MGSYRTVKTRALGLKMVSGNLGIGKIWNFSKDQRTCGVMAQFCKPECYMRKFNAMYPSVRACHKHNTDIVKGLKGGSDWIDFEYDILDFFQWKKVELFRIHVNGDFMDDTDLYAWFQIAQQAPNTQILAFTKRIDLMEQAVVDAINSLPNFQVYLSIFHTMPKDIQEAFLSVGLPCSYAGKEDDNPYDFRHCSKPCDSCLYCYNAGGNVFLPLH